MNLSISIAARPFVAIHEPFPKKYRNEETWCLSGAVVYLRCRRNRTNRRGFFQSNHPDTPLLLVFVLVLLDLTLVALALSCPHTTVVVETTLVSVLMGSRRLPLCRR